MKLTIIPNDGPDTAGNITGAVGKNDVFYNFLDLSSCNIPADIHALQWDGATGWIEYNSPLVENQSITELPAWVNCCVTKWDEANAPVPPTPPTAEFNKKAAVKKLQATDWTTLPDVSDPTKSNPYLSNTQDFIVYRNALRQIAINPVAGDINWPTLPQEVWTPV